MTSTPAKKGRESEGTRPTVRGTVRSSKEGIVPYNIYHTEAMTSDDALNAASSPAKEAIETIEV